MRVLFRSKACADDLADGGSVRDLCAIPRERFGRVDILHNNAGDTRISQMAADSAIEDMDCGIWDRACTLNVRGTMLMIKHCVHSMIEMGHGSIINIGSGEIGRASCRERVCQYV